MATDQLRGLLRVGFDGEPCADHFLEIRREQLHDILAAEYVRLHAEHLRK